MLLKVRVERLRFLPLFGNDQPTKLIISYEGVTHSLFRLPLEGTRFVMKWFDQTFPSNDPVFVLSLDEAERLDICLKRGKMTVAEARIGVSHLQKNLYLNQNKVELDSESLHQPSIWFKKVEEEPREVHPALEVVQQPVLTSSIILKRLCLETTSGAKLPTHLTISKAGFLSRPFCQAPLMLRDNDNSLVYFSHEFPLHEQKLEVSLPENEHQMIKIKLMRRRRMLAKANVSVNQLRSTLDSSNEIFFHKKKTIMKAVLTCRIERYNQSLTRDVFFVPTTHAVQETSTTREHVEEETTTTVEHVVEETSRIEGYVEEASRTGEPVVREVMRIVEETSRTDQPVAEEASGTDQPVAEEASGTDQPVAEEASGTEQPVAEEASGTDQPVAEEASGTEQPVAEEASGTNQTVAEEAPRTEQLAMNESSPSPDRVQSPIRITISDAQVLNIVKYPVVIRLISSIIMFAPPFYIIYTIMFGLTNLSDTLRVIMGDAAEPYALAIYTGYILCVLLVYIGLAFSNPGRVKPGDYEKAGGGRSGERWEYCRICDMKVPPVAIHCLFCGYCSWERDHHCIMLGSCVGRDNYKLYETLMVTSIIALSIQTIDVYVLIARGEHYQCVERVILKILEAGLLFTLHNALRLRRKKLKGNFPQYVRATARVADETL